MSKVHTLTTLKDQEENEVEKLLTKATNVIKFFIKENDDLKHESYRNKVCADMYKSYYLKLETKLENSFEDIAKLNGKLNDITTTTKSKTSEKFFDENFFKAYARNLSDDDKKKMEAEIMSSFKPKY
jgi:hypothetical protein